MATTAKSKYQLIVGHVCSACGKSVLTKVELITQGGANALIKERQKAEAERDKAYEQAMKDMVACYQMPRMLGSITEIPTETNRTSGFYQYQGLDTPCPDCGHMEPWQAGKKSFWNSVDGSFLSRTGYPEVPEVSRPVLLKTEEDVAAWLADPKSKAPEVKQKKAAAPLEDWVCAKCKTNNLGRVGVCQGCGVTKQWSVAQTAKRSGK